MNLKTNASVMTADGREVGRVERVVLDPKSNEITYLIVRKGALFTEDKVLPIGLVAGNEGDSIHLNPNAGDLSTLPNYEEKSYLPADEDVWDATGVSPVYSYPAYGTAGMAPTLTASQPAYVERTLTNIPENDVAVKSGAHVKSRSGKHVGDVVEVLMSAGDNRASHIVVASGLLFKSRKLVPMEWVSGVTEDEVTLAVSDQTFERLPEYVNISERAHSV